MEQMMSDTESFLRAWAAKPGPDGKPKHIISEDTWKHGPGWSSFGCKEHCGGIFTKMENSRRVIRA